MVDSDLVEKHAAPGLDDRRFVARDEQAECAFGYAEARRSFGKCEQGGDRFRVGILILRSAAIVVPHAGIQTDPVRRRRPA